METVTKHSAIIALRTVVNTYGAATKNPAAQYVWRTPVDGWAPCCLVGHALVRLGADPDKLLLVNGQYVSRSAVHKELPFSFTLGAVRVLAAAQRAADRRATWGDALEDAIAETVEDPT